MSKMGQQDCAFQTSDRFVNNKNKKSNIVFQDHHILILGNEYHIELKDYRFETQCQAFIMWGREDAVNHFSIPPKHIQEKSLGPPRPPFLDCMTVSWCVFVNRTDIHASFHHSVDLPPWGKKKKKIPDTTEDNISVSPGSWITSPIIPSLSPPHLFQQITSRLNTNI